jgi:hypothetical protein
MDPYEYEKNWGDSFDDLGPEYWEDYLGGPDFEDDECVDEDGYEGRYEDDDLYECDSAEYDGDSDEDDEDEEQDDEIDCEEIEKRQVMIVRWLTGEEQLGNA